MSRLIIEGGRPLTGTVTLGGAKNSCFKLMVASLLADGETRLKNLSLIGEVRHTATMIESLGGQVRFTGHEAIIDNRGVKQWRIDPDLGRFSRASTLFLGPLLARFKRAVVPLPGGDAIGKRPLERHYLALESLGVKIRETPVLIEAKALSFHGGCCRFVKNSHTGTETVIMAAVLAPGRTIIEAAAREPEVDDLINFLNKMGAKIRRRGSRIEITGVKSLHQTEFTVMPDRNQAVSFAVAALVTGGEVTIKNTRADHLTAFLDKLKETGAGIEAARNSIRFFTRGKLTAASIINRPHPGFMTNWQPLWSVLMTQASGTAKIIEAVFLQRFQAVPDLIKMGAKIEFFNPQPKQPERFYNFNLNDDETANNHGIRISGPTQLRGGKFFVRYIRNGATLAIAGLVASGRTILANAQLIDRGYEDFAGSLQSLGAKIKRV